jgi:hypothetical protein
MEKSKQVSYSSGDRKYRVKKENISKLENQNLTQFEKHMIQEGIKQVLFVGGTEEIFDKENEIITRQVPKELIQFLLDYDVIEEFKF